MPQTDQDRAIALASMFQATDLVRSIARTGQANPEDFKTCVDSLFKIDAPNSEAIYGGVEHLKKGLRLLVEQLLNPKDMEITRYVIALFVLERKLRKRPSLLQKIRQGIEETMAKLEYFPLTHDNIIASLADIYTSTISTLGPRIMVNGEPVHLNQPENAARIRALLLAGIRSAILWRQSGGGRLTLLLQRKRLTLEAKRLLASMEEECPTPPTS